MNNKYLQMTRALTAAAVLVGLAGCAGVNKAPEVTHDGLVEIDSKAFATVYEKPGASVAGYNQFAVTDCQVSFRKNWLRNQNDSRMGLGNRVTKEDMDKIRESLASMCNDEFIGVLKSDSAYKLVGAEQVNNETLLLKPSIINLDVAAPDVQSAGRSQSYTTDSGEMTLFLEVADASTGEVLYRVVDRRRDSGSGRLQWTNSVTNAADAKRVLGGWGKQLREGLDRVVAEQKGSSAN